MLKTKRYFDRGDHVLEVDHTSGKRVTRYIPKIPPEQAAARTLPGGDLKMVSKHEGEQPKRPGPIRRAVNYGKSTAKHLAAGMPKASLETTKERFSICKPCPLYKVLEPKDVPKTLKHLPEVGTCLHAGCGCFLYPEVSPPGKLARADEECPKKRWLKAVSV